MAGISDLFRVFALFRHLGRRQKKCIPTGNLQLRGLFLFSAGFPFHPFKTGTISSAKIDTANKKSDCFIEIVFNIRQKYPVLPAMVDTYAFYAVELRSIQGKSLNIGLSCIFVNAIRICLQ
jgi:hypothetical protein